MIKYETLKVNYTKGDKGYLLYTESPYMYGEEIEDREHFRKLIINKFQKEDKILFNRFINSLIDNYWCRTLYYNTKKAQNERDIKYEKYKHHQIKKIRRIKLETKSYIIKDCNNNTYKIGKSKNPLKREKTLQSEKPNLKLIKIFENNIEKELHELYKDCRLRGEWFKLNNIQLEYICKNYK